jgi:glycerol uptake facilitator-like aquaporin
LGIHHEKLVTFRGNIYKENRRKKQKHIVEEAFILFFHFLSMQHMKKYAAEAMGTMVLVLLGCGSAVLAGMTAGNLHIAMAFGLAVVAMAYTIGHVSGCHINPAVTVGMCVSGRMKWGEGLGYIIAQCVGAIVGALVLSYIATGMLMSDKL